MPVAPPPTSKERTRLFVADPPDLAEAAVGGVDRAVRAGDDLVRDRELRRAAGSLRPGGRPARPPRRRANAATRAAALCFSCGEHHPRMRAAGAARIGESPVRPLRGGGAERERQRLAVGCRCAASRWRRCSGGTSASTWPLVTGAVHVASAVGAAAPPTLPPGPAVEPPPDSVDLQHLLSVDVPLTSRPMPRRRRVVHGQRDVAGRRGDPRARGARYSLATPGVNAPKSTEPLRERQVHRRCRRCRSRRSL